MEEKLNIIFGNVNDWLKYSEAKSATLLAANGLIVFGVLRIVKDESLHLFVECYVLFLVIQLIISFIVCAVSFIPSLEMPWLFRARKVINGENLLYFEHISNYSTKSFLDELSRVSGLRNKPHTEYERLLAEQIITNSVIATKKYKLFSVAIWFTLSAIVTPIGAILLYEFK